MKKNIVILLISALSIIGCKDEEITNITYGQMCQTPETTEKPVTNPDENKPFVLNPDSLRLQLLKDNTSILLGVNQVHQAKDQVNISRANLLPNLNLSSLLYAAGSPTFTLAAVDILLPFLVPSHWARYKQSKSAFWAQIEALKSIRMNVYASAYSLTKSVWSDIELKKILINQVNDLKKVEKLVEQLYQSGLASKADLERIQGQRSLAEISLSKIEGLVSQEISSLKHILGLPLKSQIQLETIIVPLSEFETENAEFIFTKAKESSPELQQMLHLEKAAQSDISAQKYAFIGGAGIHTPSMKDGDGSVAFDNISTGVNFNIGYAQFPMVELSQNRMKEILLRTQEVERELADRSEYALSLVAEAKYRNDLSIKAEQSWKSVFDHDMIRYKYGQVDLQTVLQTRSQLNNASIELLRSQTQLALNRILLHRLLGTNQFAQVKECH